MDKKDKLESRRNFLKKAGYAVPVILTMKAMPALAGIGSHMRGPKGNEGVGNGEDGPPPGTDMLGKGNFNDGNPYVPGNPGGMNK